jgi:hypothetical protein
MLRRHAARKRVGHGGADGVRIVVGERVDETRRRALLAADQAPDVAPVARIELVDARFLLDHFGAVHAEPSLLGRDEIRAQRRRERHPTEAADHACNHADDRHVAAQRDDRRLNFGDDRKPEIRFLQTHAAGLEHDDRTQSRNASSSAPAILLPDTSPMLPP